MNEHSIALVRESWRRVDAIAPAAATLFYENLFAADPSLRALFRGDMAQQGDRLMRMIGAAVRGLDDLPTLLPALQDLARRHVGYGVQPAHYDTVGAALLKTLGQGLADEFTPPVRQAWTEVYGAISGIMLVAASDGDARRQDAGSARDASIASRSSAQGAP